MQSPTLGILCAREKEIDLFVPEEFLDLIIELSDDNGKKLICSLYSENGKSLKAFCKNEELANLLKEKILNENFSYR